MAVTVTSVLSVSTWNDTSLASANKTVNKGILLMAMQATAANAPTVAGVAMTLLGTFDFFKVYIMEVVAGTYAVACSGDSRFYHMVNVTGQTKNKLNSSNQNTSQSVTVSHSGGLNVCIGFQYWTTDEAEPGGVTPPSGFTELADTTTTGSGEDWAHGAESCYRVTGASPVSATFSVSHSLTGGYNAAAILEFEYPSSGGLSPAVDLSNGYGVI